MMQELTMRSSGRRPIQKQRRPKGWTAAKRTRFLNILAATCNVVAACNEIGLCPTGAYALRRRNPEFAAAWKAALLTGYDRLEAELLRGAIAAVAGRSEGDADDAMVTGPVSVDQAIRLLDRHYAMMKPGARTGGPARPVATQEETDAMLLKRLASIDRQRERRA